MKTTKTITLNDMVAVLPIKQPQASQELANPRSRIAISSKLNGELVGSEVVFDGPDGIKQSDIAYFTSDVYNYPGTRKILSLNGKEFILVPKTMMIAKEGTND